MGEVLTDQVTDQADIVLISGDKAITLSYRPQGKLNSYA